MIKCEYCEANNIDSESNCKRCGAPLSKKVKYFSSISDYGMCVCGMRISDEILEYDIKDVLCHKCFRTHEAKFRARYHHDNIYLNGQITHVYKTSGVECPYCGTIASYHEFYHGLTEDSGVDSLINHAKLAKIGV